MEDSRTDSAREPRQDAYKEDKPGWPLNRMLSRMEAPTAWIAVAETARLVRAFCFGDIPFSRHLP